MSDLTDDEIRLIATTSNYEENRILATEILRLRAELQAVRRDRDIEHKGRDKAWMRAKKAGDALDSLRAEIVEAVALLDESLHDLTIDEWRSRRDAFLAKHKEPT